VAKVVVDLDGLDDPRHGLLAERRYARRDDRHAADQTSTQFVVEGANPRYLDFHDKSS